MREEPGAAPVTPVPDDVEPLARARHRHVEQVRRQAGPGTRTELSIIRRTKNEDHGLGFPALNGVNRAHPCLNISDVPR